jgi:3-oxoacyl-[acyl-carrier-protein] synthase II
MIVDLLRNDISRICEAGSVSVPALFRIEPYPTVWQMTSSIRGRIRQGETPVSIIRALFPCGSITGAPKIMASRIIASLERWDRAQARGAHVFGELLGCGLSNEAAHITRPGVEGQAAALQAALQSAGIAPEQVDAINAHGTGTPANDSTETAAIRAVFGRHAERLPISATKAVHGHLLGAAGALECVLSFMAMRHAVALPTMHLQQPDPACDLDYVPNAAREGVAARVMLSNSFAFGGSNAVLVLGAA